MCGIAGIVTPPDSSVDGRTLSRMTASLRHRGPDADGLYVAGNVGLGHRRLTVIDTSAAANQPFLDPAGEVAVVFNGEIYNFRQLRRELEGRGHRFRTSSDTEVLVHSWLAFGAGMLEHLRGMFAFALFDRRSGELFLARDRLGKKPLFYCAAHDRFVFGSEIKALLAVEGVSRELEEQAIRDYAVYGHSVAERTIFRAIRKLPPAHLLRLDTRDGDFVPRIERYWRVPVGNDRSLTRKRWLERLDEVVEEAVRLRLVSDVPLGAFLSGGIDSSLIVSYMVRHTPGRVKTFAIGFPDPGLDEARHARLVAEHLGTEHHVEYVEPDGVAILPELVTAYDEPFADSSAVPTYYLSQMTRRHVTVALSGDGGDELFFGYQHHRQCLLLDRAARLLTPAGRALVRRAARPFPYGSLLRSVLGRLSHVGFDLYHHALGYGQEQLGLLRRELRAGLPDPAQSPAAEAFRRGGHSLLRSYQSMDLHNYLPEDILVKVDRASMAHSLEVRCPLLDHKVVEMAAQIPPALQMGLREQKILLRRLAYRHIPRRLLDRPKLGFGMPVQRWFRNELAPLFREILDDRRSPTWEYFDPRAARRRFDDHLAGRCNSGVHLWRLLFFHRWCAAFLGE